MGRLEAEDFCHIAPDATVTVTFWSRAFVGSVKHIARTNNSNVFIFTHNQFTLSRWLPPWLLCGLPNALAAPETMIIKIFECESKFIHETAIMRRLYRLQGRCVPLSYGLVRVSFTSKPALAMQYLSGGNLWTLTKSFNGSRDILKFYNDGMWKCYKAISEYHVDHRDEALNNLMIGEALGVSPRWWAAIMGGLLISGIGGLVGLWINEVEQWRMACIRVLPIVCIRQSALVRSELRADWAQVPLLVFGLVLFLHYISSHHAARQTVFLIDFGEARYCGLKQTPLARARRWIDGETEFCGSAAERSCLCNNEISAGSLSDEIEDRTAKKVQILHEDGTEETIKVGNYSTPSFDHLGWQLNGEEFRESTENSFHICSNNEAYSEYPYGETEGRLRSGPITPSDDKKDFSGTIREYSPLGNCRWTYGNETDGSVERVDLLYGDEAAAGRLPDQAGKLTPEKARQPEIEDTRLTLVDGESWHHSPGPAIGMEAVISSCKGRCHESRPRI